ncbi:zf-TFIIB domain-containing protein [Ignavibacterium album]|uniref:TFIIB-type zinc ribbon-containing protein n=1 Tax=Ignavibacterium album TaxID=591197 RepID=UPI0026EDB6E6|nr:zf-TFIIB domain-containing protein [Ignavibacterium album]
MNCPICKEPMIILELNRVEIDYCPVCSGIWLDEGELELLYSIDNTESELKKLFRESSDSKEKSFKCPVCRKKMIKIRFNNTELIIDKCPVNHGLWFNKGELEKVLSAKTNQSSQKVLSLLKEMFSYNKSQEAE